MKKFINYFSIVLSGLILVGCKKAETEDTRLNYSFNVVSKVSTIGIANPNVANSNTITWESGYVNLAEFKFEAQKESGQINYSYKPKEVTKVDFFIPNQIVGGISFPFGAYKQVEVKVSVKQTANTAAMLLKGTFVTNGGAKVPLELSLTDTNDEMEFGIKAKDMVVGEKNTYTGVIKMRLDALMYGVSSAELDQATRTNGVLIINKNSNPTIYAKIKANVPDFTDIEFSTFNGD